jgi:hypothetical protein
LPGLDSRRKIQFPHKSNRFEKHPVDSRIHELDYRDNQLSLRISGSIPASMSLIPAAVEQFLVVT